MPPALPPIIALCGNPTSGKSTAAGILADHFGYHLMDDGLPLRKIAMDYLGLTSDQVFTQAGKLEKVMLNGREWTAREILGEIGNTFEEKFGGEIIPMMSHNAATPGVRFVTGSVRRDQGFYWARHGALVLEIRNPLAGPSPYEFDRFNDMAVHKTIHNDGLARGLDTEVALRDLKAKLLTAVANTFMPLVA